MQRRRQSINRGGRPPLGRNRHDYGPYVELPFLEELRIRAQDLDLPLSRYCDAILALAHGFESPYLPDISGYLEVSAEHLREYARSEIVLEHGLMRMGPTHRLKMHADEALALEIEARCEDQDFPYADYLRAILRVAVGYPIDGSGQIEQAELQLGEVAS